MRGSVGVGMLGLALAAATSLVAAEIKVDLSKETVGKPPQTFEPMVGTWVVAQDGTDKVIMVDGRPWVASKDNPTKLLIESARKLYGTSNEELMDNAKQFAYYPVAVLKTVKDFSNGTISFSLKQSGLQVSLIDDDVVIVGPAGRLSYRFRTAPGTDWTDFSVRLSESEGWTWNWNKRATQAQIESVLVKATRLDIRGEYVTGPDEGSLDNFVLRGP